MSRGQAVGPVTRAKRLGPLLAVLLVALGAGCADRTTTPAEPSFELPIGSARSTGQPAGTPTAPTPTAAPSPQAARQPVSGSPTAGANLRYVFPVQTGNIAYHPTHSAYPATDIFADCGSPVVAVTDGRVLEVSRVDEYRRSGPDGPLNGGKFVSLLGDDTVRYYGSHLAQVTVGIEAGVRVRAGQQIGTVGRTGNANNVCHLHFGISPPCQRTGDWWIRRGVVWPAPFLNGWRKKISKSPTDKVDAWYRDQGCPTAP